MATEKQLIEKLIEIHKQLEAEGLMVTAGKRTAAELLVSRGVVPVVHGEWSTIEDDYCGLIALQCSKCNQEYWFEDEPPIKIYNYCPNCGAKMDRGVGNGQEQA